MALQHQLFNVFNRPGYQRLNTAIRPVSYPATYPADDRLLLHPAPVPNPLDFAANTQSSRYFSNCVPPP